MAGFTFETLVDELRTQFDCSQARAVEVANHALDLMLTEAEALEYLKTLGNTTSGTSTYSLTASIQKLKQIRVDYTAGTILYEAAPGGLRMLWDLDVGNLYANSNEAYFAIVADTDDDATTSSFRLYPTPAESSKAMTGRYTGLPADLAYATATALPIPADTHDALLAGCRAEFYRRDEDNPNLAAPEQQVFETGVALLKKRINARGEGDAPIRAQLWGFEFL
jgi:hypothetical protein